MSHQIYGFNRLVRRSSRGIYPPEASKVWKHVTLSSECTLQDIQAFRRRAKPKKRSSSTKGKPIKSKKTRRDRADPDISDEDELSEDVSILPKPAPASNLDVVKIPQEVSDPASPPTTEYHTAASDLEVPEEEPTLSSARDEPYQLCSSNEVSQWLNDQNEYEEDSSSGSSFEEAWEAKLAVDAMGQSGQDEETGGSASAFRFADEGLFFYAPRSH
ncbi:hypothetical protein P389DRAFT_92625 [Cystobasidium minutum MCA 4210]|uniref:uncharacterized protein n=1 Tax=Cystobasidium minutum MCA 4210 TaxID=1397322 RepID=UPI0034CF9B3C|eukprot:jgi/Rhomi1/92625/CE92624_281